MITTPTVLILGAGASKSYGFPTGEELKREICEELNADNIKSLILTLGEYDIRGALCQAGFAKQLIQQFRDKLARSPRSSVDAFLEHQPEYVQVGKAAMAAVLLTHENDRTLFESRDSWYALLFREMCGEFDSIGKNQLTILTYNYDTSLERYFYEGLCTSYPQSNDSCKLIAEKLPIIHLHGLLGEHQYGDGLNHVDLTRSAESIKIISDDVWNDPVFQRANKALSNAVRIVFLGFGYNPTNLGRLDLSSDYTSNKYGSAMGAQKPNASIYGTCLDLTEHEMKQICSRFSQRFKRTLHLGHHQWDAYRFLRERDVLS